MAPSEEISDSSSARAQPLADPYAPRSDVRGVGLGFQRSLVQDELWLDNPRAAFKSRRSNTLGAKELRALQGHADVEQGGDEVYDGPFSQTLPKERLMAEDVLHRTRWTSGALGAGDEQGYPEHRQDSAADSTEKKQNRKRSMLARFFKSILR